MKKLKKQLIEEEPFETHCTNCGEDFHKCDCDSPFDPNDFSDD